MNEQQQEIRLQQQQSWNRFSGGWKKWDPINMVFLRPAGDAIIAAIKPIDRENILDVASGTGEPALTIATMIKNGKVTLTDLSEDMLAIAVENATQRGIANIEAKQCDVSELPFENNTFDAISCRFGFMFYPDMLLAAKEMVRVLKPGGRIATTVWNGPDKNFWVTAMMGTIAKHVEMPPPPPGAPSMFRCAQPGMMAELFKQAGFKNVNEKEVPLKMNPGTKETYWTMMTEVGAPIVAALSKTDDATRDKIKKEVFGLIDEKFPNGKVMIDASANLISGEK
jgi:ubiquinone/menaquinone biosynthesis C-methylase UbiE